MTTIHLPPVAQDHAYWLGWLATTSRETIRHLEATDEHGEPLMTREQAAAFARDMLGQYLTSDIGASLSPAIGDGLYAGYVVEAANGEPQALRDTYQEADAALITVESYWWEAENCGHPDAPGYVAKMRPFTIRQVTQAERDELSEYPPVIDREP